MSIHKEIQCLNSRLASIGNCQIRSIKWEKNAIKVCVCPDAGYWAEKELKFEIRTKRYPKQACKVICKSNILHPNILESDGEVCLNIFDEDWQPSMRIEDYISGILYILHNPNFDDPLSDYFWIAKDQGKLPQAISSLS